MVDKCAALKCSGYAISEKKQSAKFHFPLKSVELKKQWFVLLIEEIDWQRNTQCCVNYILKTNMYGEVKNVRDSGRCILYPLFIRKNF